MFPATRRLGGLTIAPADSLYWNAMTLSQVAEPPNPGVCGTRSSYPVPNLSRCLGLSDSLVQSDLVVLKREGARSLWIVVCYPSAKPPTETGQLAVRMPAA